MGNILLTTALTVTSLMLFMWLISIPLRNVAIIDIAWGLGFPIIAWITSALALSTVGSASSEFAAPSAWLLPLLSTIWGVRLSGYLWWRNAGEPEDKRYAAMRANRGDGFWWQSLFLVFLLQAGLMWIVSLPLQVGIVQAENGWTWLHVVGVLLFAVGLAFEAVGDWQLARFKSRPENAGKVFDRGLWRYTRHPNYFGDFCVWWGFFAIAVAHGQGLWTSVGPLVMTVLLMRVSGVTLLEKTMSQKPDFADYARRTSAFFPWKPASPQ